jgi:hypothetical protein
VFTAARDLPKTSIGQQAHHHVMLHVSVLFYEMHHRSCKPACSVIAAQPHDYEALLLTPICCLLLLCCCLCLGACFPLHYTHAQAQQPNQP